VQQRSVRPLDDKFAERLEISRVPTRLMSRLGPESDEEERKKEAEDPRNKAIKRHEEQQRRVVEYLDKARKIQPDPKKGFRDPDNLFRNTVGLLDGGKLTLTILSPTHYSPNLHFDSRFKHPKIGGDYPADRKAPGAGLIFDDTTAFGTVLPSSAPASPNPIQTLPSKVAAVPALPGEMRVFTRGLDLTEDGFKNTFVHEGQHVADLNPRLPKASSWNDLLEAYKSEFRAFWIQPPPPRVGGIAPQSIDNLPEPTGRAGKPDNSSKLTISHGCTICPAPDPSAKAFEEHKTGMRNARQEKIFWHIMSNYKAQEYDCCYVYNDAFHREVNRFSVPESVNLINSDRMMNLNLALHTLNLSMTVSQVVGTQLAPLLTALEPLDWAFLKDTTLSAPFWTLLDGNAPKFVHDAIKALEKSGTRKQVTEAEVTAALSGKLKP